MNAELELRLAGHEDAAVMHDIIQAAFKARPPLDPPADALGETVDDTRRHLEDCTGIIASRTDIGCLPTPRLLRSWAVKHQGQGLRVRRPIPAERRRRGPDRDRCTGNDGRATARMWVR